MAKAWRGSTASKSVSTETPRKLVPSLDHLVTQWMSQGTSSKGSSANSSQDHSVGSATMPSMRRRHSPVGTSGVGPAVSTGKPDSAYWPGGSRSVSSSGVRRRPLNPRETKPFTPPSSRSTDAGASGGPRCFPSGTRTLPSAESMSSPRFGQGSSFSVSSSLYSTGGRGGRSSSLLSTWKSLEYLKPNLRGGNRKSSRSLHSEPRV